MINCNAEQLQTDQGTLSSGDSLFATNRISGYSDEVDFFLFQQY